MCVIGTTLRTSRNVNYRMYADTFGLVFIDKVYI